MAPPETGPFEKRQAMTVNKYALYTQSIKGSDAIAKMREDIKRMMGMLVAGMSEVDLEKIKECRIVTIADGDADWAMQMLPESQDTLEIWLEINGSNMCICTVKFGASQRASAIDHRDIPHFLIRQVDNSMPTLVHGMMSKFPSVSRALVIKHEAATHYEATRCR